MRVLSIKILPVILIFISLVFLYSFGYAQGTFLNEDPDFDKFYTAGDSSSGAWKPYKISNPGPSIWKHPTEGWPKGPSLWIYGDAMTFDGGVYQVVAVIPGNGYHFEVAWAVVRHGGEAVHDDSQLIRQVGIDPFGGTNPLSTNVQWSGEYRGSGKFAQELSIDQYARSDHITIFLRAKNLYTDQRNEVFFDHAVLTNNPGMPPISVAPPTATLAPSTPTRAATLTAVRTRVSIANTATSTIIPTATALVTATEVRNPTVTRTARTTVENLNEDSASPDTSRLIISLVVIACLACIGVILMVAAFLFLFAGHRRIS